jgi:hypothetical protein
VLARLWKKNLSSDTFRPLAVFVIYGDRVSLAVIGLPGPSVGIPFGFLVILGETVFSCGVSKKPQSFLPNHLVFTTLRDRDL